MTNLYRRIQAKTNSAIRMMGSKWIFNRGSFFLGIFDSAQSRIFDCLLRVSTRGIFVTKDSNFVIGGDNCAYAGCQWLPLRRALKDLEPKPSDVFVDLGSGKGKALLIAGRLPYRRVVGVEIDDKLSQYARHNIKLAHPRLRAQQVDSVTANVLEWPIPDETSLIFMYNPFIGQTFRTAMGQIFQSYDRKPRDLHIVYGYPWEHDWLLSTGRVVVENVRPSTWQARLRWWQSGDVIVSYRVVGISERRQSDSLPRRFTRPNQAVRRWSRPNAHRFTMNAPGQETLYSQP